MNSERYAVVILVGSACELAEHQLTLREARAYAASYNLAVAGSGRLAEVRRQPAAGDDVSIHINYQLHVH